MRVFILIIFLQFGVMANAQFAEVCHNEKKELTCIRDSLASISFSNGMFDTFKSNDGRFVYNDAARTFIVKLLDHPFNEQTEFKLVLNDKEILFDGNAIALLYDSTLDYFVTAYTKDSTRSMHQSQQIWASPEKKIYFSFMYEKGKMREISFNSDNWQGQIDLAVDYKGMVHYFKIKLNKGWEAEYEITFGEYKRRTATELYAVDNDSKIALLAMAFKKEQFSRISFFSMKEEEKNKGYLKEYRYQKGIAVTGNIDISICNCK